MSWTYDTSLATDKDKVRFFVGDTDTNNPLVSDEEIQAIISWEANAWMAAAEIAEHIARDLTAGGTLEDRKVGETRLKYKRASGLLALSKRLRTRGSAHMKPSAGGIYVANRTSYDNNEALDKPNLAKNMMDNPRAGSGSSGLDSKKSVDEGG